MKVITRLAKNGLEEIEGRREEKVVIRGRSSSEAVRKRKREAGLLNYRKKKSEDWMPARIVELMSEGKSRYEVAAELGVVTDTLEKWEREKEEFAEALHLGEEASRAWWERKARENLTSTGNVRFNTSLWTFNMKNRFGWADVSKVETKSTVKEVEEKRKEIEETHSEKHTAQVLEILRGAGVLESTDNPVTEASAD